MTAGRTVLIVLFVSVVLFLVDISFDNSLIVKFLSKNSRNPNYNVLLVEGWMQPESFSKACKEFWLLGYHKIITTGLDAPEYFQASMDGNLIFDTDSILNGFKEQKKHTITVNAYSEHDITNASHFKLWVNDKNVNACYVINTPLSYNDTWEGRLCDIDSLTIQFDNDGMGVYGDRNLYIKDIVIDDTIFIPYMLHSKYDFGKLDGINCVNNNYTSLAEQARSIMIAYGVHPSQIIAVTGHKKKINRTLSSALAVREWIKETGYKPKSINVVSSGIHSRRTWRTYKSILGNSIPVGIVSIDDNTSNFIGNHKLFKIVRELAALAYYRVILLFY